MAGRKGNEFTKNTIEEVARRAGYLCSRPRCAVSTVAATSTARGVRNIGVAAHIAGAARDSARYDASMSSDERKAPENGVWLCQNHAKEIDDDEIAYPVELLQRWKAERESAAQQELGRPQAKPAATPAERERLPPRYRVLYVDYRFLLRQSARYVREAQARLIDRHLDFPDPASVVLRSLDWLHQRSFVTVYVFASPEDEDEFLLSVEGRVLEYDKGEVRFHLMVYELYEAHLGEHLEENAGHFDDIYIIGDSAAFIAPLLTIERHKLKLLRRENATTAFRDTDLVNRRWQDIDYVIGDTLGLQTHEM